MDLDQPESGDWGGLPVSRGQSCLASALPGQGLGDPILDSEFNVDCLIQICDSTSKQRVEPRAGVTGERGSRIMETRR
jgi:hypothetical protein